MDGGSAASMLNKIAGSSASYIAADVTESDELAQIVAEVSRHESSLDVRVNNADLAEYDAYEPPAPMLTAYDQES
ncbi:hypothetical protein EWM64_g9332 [Hericium alpestre]|uniref:Ketoreductase (KR) domain-containing protein n=1 Tax=Hericium alpestre TaxID=135208 RepID=A0A4Y9ZJ12_9AGAM|nr:hypothetical protein EWM64_g9332 [Hericium alpestre]